eukprot:TRINITY_DN55326_c0_g1_i1.p1 TRINITY_DN55326_c0_g1~~TRINITY_DN55326_c0_g1_i1.p1  ORF type:complete len:659 (+),score=114.58 TRINITY_DN55326_c0_g1_i1:71-1978(+)
MALFAGPVQEVWKAAQELSEWADGPAVAARVAEHTVAAIAGIPIFVGLGGGPSGETTSWNCTWKNAWRPPPGVVVDPGNNGILQQVAKGVGVIIDETADWFSTADNSSPLKVPRGAAVGGRTKAAEAAETAGTIQRPPTSKAMHTCVELRVQLAAAERLCSIERARAEGSEQALRESREEIEKGEAARQHLSDQLAEAEQCMARMAREHAEYRLAAELQLCLEKELRERAEMSQVEHSERAQMTASTAAALAASMRTETIAAVRILGLQTELWAGAADLADSAHAGQSRYAQSTLRSAGPVYRKRYLLQHKLGKGQTGTVVNVYDRRRRTAVAMKLLPLISSDEFTIDPIEEVSVTLAMSGIRNAAGLLDLVDPLADVDGLNEDTLAELQGGQPRLSQTMPLGLAMPLFAGGSLEDFVKAGKVMAPSDVCRMLLQVGGALRCLWARRRAHRDLHPGNIMIGRASGGETSEMSFHIIDYGRAWRFDARGGHDEERGVDADCWGLGVSSALLLGMRTGRGGEMGAGYIPIGLLLDYPNPVVASEVESYLTRSRLGCPLAEATIGLLRGPVLRKQGGPSIDPYLPLRQLEAAVAQRQGGSTQLNADAGGTSAEADESRTGCIHPDGRQRKAGVAPGRQ